MAQEQIQGQGQEYAVVSTDDGQILVIPLLWLSNNNSLLSGQKCEWHYPTKLKIEKSVQFTEDCKYWNKNTGCILNISDSYLTAKFLAIVETLKIKKFVIVELLNKTNTTVIVPCHSIIINHELKQITCRLNNIKEKVNNQQVDSWKEYNCIIKKYFNTYNEAKKELSNFHNAAIVQNESNKRKLLVKNHMNPSSSYDNTEQNSIMTTTQLSKSMNNIASNLDETSMTSSNLNNSMTSSNLDDSMTSSNTKKLKNSVVSTVPETTYNNILPDVQNNLSNEIFSDTLFENILQPNTQYQNYYNPSATYNISVLNEITHEVITDVISNQDSMTSVYSNEYSNNILSPFTPIVPIDYNIPMPPMSQYASMTHNTSLVAMTVNTSIVHNIDNDSKIQMIVNTTMTSMTQNTYNVPKDMHNTPMIPTTQNTSMIPISLNTPLAPMTHNSPIVPMICNTPVAPMTHNTPITQITPYSHVAPITPVGPSTAISQISPITPIVPLPPIASITPMAPMNSEKKEEYYIQFPINNIEDLEVFETHGSHRHSLIKVLMQNRRCDVKHTTYQMMKIVISNSLAKCLNVTGKKGNKLCFLDMELYNIIVECIRYFYPEERVLEINKYIGDWFKQASARKQV